MKCGGIRLYFYKNFVKPLTNSKGRRTSQPPIESIATAERAVVEEKGELN